MSEWQPIETAPKDGTVWGFASLYQGTDNTGEDQFYDWQGTMFWWVDYTDPSICGWESADEVISTSKETEPTHWRPLPSPPQALNERSK